MAQSEDIKRAEDLLRSGKHVDAARVLLSVIGASKVPEDKYRAILLLVEIPTVFPGEMILPICDEGISMARQHRRNEELAYLLCKKAGYTTTQISKLVHELKELKLVPEWIGFALEREKQRFEELEKLIASLEKETNELLEESRKLAEASPSKASLAHLLQQTGVIQALRYLNYRMLYLGNSKVAIWVNNLGLNTHFGFKRWQRRQMTQLQKSCEHHLQKAAETFNSLNQELNAGIAIYNLALWQKSFNKFRQAMKSLNIAKQVAEKYQYRDLLDKIPLVENSIRKRNKDIPNYLAGETR